MRRLVGFNRKYSPRLSLAWIVMLIASPTTLIIWRQFGSGEPPWWPLVTATALLALLVLTIVLSTLKPLRMYIAILTAIFFLGFGGGWDWGLISFVRASPAWVSWSSQTSWAFSAIATHLLRLTPAVAVISFLRLAGRSRSGFFLVKGSIYAPVEPSRLLGMKEPEPWTRIGSLFAVVFSLGTFVFLLVTARPSPNAFPSGLPLIPVALLIAGINAFNEEFTLRAAPLSELSPAVGKQQALGVTTVYFGLGHFYGVPNGILGVLLAGFLGWFLGKSMLETRGFFWAWLIHFLQDAIIFSFIAISAMS